MLLYFGPEVMAPLATAAAAVAGAVLMFWRRFVGTLRSMGRGLTGLFKRNSDAAPGTDRRRAGTRRKRRARPTGSSGAS